MIVSREQDAGRRGKCLFRGNTPWRVVMVFCLFFLVPALCCVSSFAADAQVSGRYQVVTGNDDNAYLVNTETGAVWVLTYRTMATGREPVAIPYKFIGISPKSKGDFIIELAPAIPPNLKDRD